MKQSFKSVLTEICLSHMNLRARVNRRPVQWLWLRLPVLDASIRRLRKKRSIWIAERAPLSGNGTRFKLPDLAYRLWVWLGERPGEIVTGEVRERLSTKNTTSNSLSWRNPHAT